MIGGTVVKGFTRWLVKHRALVIIVCLLLLIPSWLGMTATRTKYDLLYYLPQDLETVRGQNILGSRRIWKPPSGRFRM